MGAYQVTLRAQLSLLTRTSQVGQDSDAHLSKSGKTRVHWEFLAMESRQEMKQKREEREVGE